MRISNIEVAEVKFHGKLPINSKYNDVYFSQKDGLLESAYVFVERNLSADLLNKEKIVIGELGFGSGLNFLLTAKKFLEESRSNSFLHYIAFELQPMSKEQIRKSLSEWPELNDLLSHLLKNYPPHRMGSFRIHLKSRVILTLFFGNAIDCIKQLHASADVWYLDGFAPSKNPDLWSYEILEEVAKHSKSGSTISSFTSAGQVRRDLTKLGYTISKIPGFGKKREMIVGQMIKKREFRSNTPWFDFPKIKSKQKTAIVVGGGLAGAAAARSLAVRGWKVELIEKHQKLAEEASGNLAGSIMPVLTVKPSPMSRILSTAFHLTLSHIKALEEAGLKVEWNICGVKQIPHNKKVQSRLRSCIIDQKIDPSLATWSEEDQTAHFTEGAWVNPSSLCEANVSHPNIFQIFGESVHRVERREGWSAYCSSGNIFEADVLILANSTMVKKLDQTSSFPLKNLEGQVAYLPSNETSQELKQVFSFDGYITPAVQGYHVLGSSFAHRPGIDLPHSKVDEKNTEALFKSLDTSVPGSGLRLTDWRGEGRVSNRCVSPDKLPLVGAVPHREKFLEDYSDLRHGRTKKKYPTPSHHKGLYVTVGHGSRGIMYSQLAGELLASQICDEPLPLEKDLVDYLNPARFIVRDLKRFRISI